MPKLSLLSGGAAHGLVNSVRAEFENATGRQIEGLFDAVGAMRSKLLEGYPADLIILTSAIVRELAVNGLVRETSIRDIGSVETSIAIRKGDALPIIADEASLKAALCAADAIYFPDPLRATAGIHFANVIGKLGIHDQVSSRLKTFPNGTTAMQALASATERQPIGCTQATEIIATQGAVLVAPLPAPYGLVTTYTAGVVSRSKLHDDAQALIKILCAEKHAGLRRDCGFR